MQNEMDQDQPRPISRWLALTVSAAAIGVLLLWAIGTPPGLEGKAQAIGYAICHRIPARSFQIDGMPLPLCARCTGIYLGVTVSFLVTLAAGRTRASRLPPLSVLIVLGLFVVVMGIDGVNSYIHLFPNGTGVYTPRNWLRLVTGILSGIAMFQVLFPVFNGAVWRYPTRERNLNSLGELLGLVAVCGVVVALVLTERPLFLWIFGMMSALGVAMVLSIVGTVLFLTLIRRGNYATQWRHLAIPALAGLTIALVELGLINIGRYALTGTLNGFPFGG